MKKLTLKWLLTILLLGLGFLTIGCGTETDVSSITERDVIVIFDEYDRDLCKSSLFKDQLMNLADVTDVITEVRNTNVSCADYGRFDDDTTCIEVVTTFTENTACVVGANVPN